ncbi:MAG: molybdenum cofactor guanylyltransferase [Alphaproteobacteria bacterium]
MDTRETGTVGVIIAGGLARRMGGGDKGLRRLAGRPLIACVAAAVRPQVDRLGVNMSFPPDDDEHRAEVVAAVGADAVFIDDAVPGRAGPLAGILAGLRWAAEARWLLTVPVDTPFLPRDLAARLVAAGEAAGAEVACAVSWGRLQPLVAVWRPDLAPAVAAYLAANDRKLELFLDRRRVTRVEFTAEPVDPFFNVNSPPDLEQAERLRDAGLVPGLVP